MKKRTSLLIVLVLVFSLLIGCSSSENTEINNDVDDDINQEDVELVDMAGRTVTIPKDVKKVFATEPVGTIILYSLNPDKMVGWNYDLREEEKRFIPEKYHSLPNLGGAGKESINIEEILKVDPDILVVMGKIDDALELEVEDMEEQTGKPIIILDDNIEKLDEVYKILGKALNEEEKSEELALYCKETLDDVKEKKINEDERINIYYAEGPNGLETEPAGSWHGEVIDMVDGRNVAEVEEEGSKGKSEVSIEQVLEWNPDIIISWDDERGGYYSEISKDPTWSDIKAVKNGDVYEIPNKPFNWFDRPPSVNRILGVKWLGNLLYPDIYDYNMEEVVEEFYNKFYHYELSEREIDELLGNTIKH